MAYVDGSSLHAGTMRRLGRAARFPRESMAKPSLRPTRRAGRETVEYSGDDPRLPEPVRAFSRRAGVQAVVVTPLVLGSRTLGWMTLSSPHTSEC